MKTQNQISRKLGRITSTLFIFLIAMAIASPVYSRDVNLQWDANTEDQLQGYLIYYDTDSGAPYEGVDADQGPSPIEMPLAAFADPDNPQTVLTGLSDTSDYFFAVTAYSADEESGYSNEDSVEGDQPLVAAAGPNQTVAEGVSVTLDGSNSYDPDDVITDYLWTQTGGPAVTLSDATAVQPSFTTPDVDEGGAALTFRLTVTNDQGHSATDTVTINVTWENIPPHADAGANQNVGEGEIVTLDGSNSYDLDDGVGSYSWTQTGGPGVVLSDATATAPTFAAPNVDSDGVALTFQLTVTDNNGLQDTDSVTINVSWENIPPTADAGADQTVDEGVMVTLDGSNSHDPDDGLSTYAWTQTGGPNVTLSDTTSAQPTFTAPDVNFEGIVLTFQLTVTDNNGLQDTDSVTINVTWENVPPHADAGPDQTVDEGETVSLDGSGSYDLDDGVASYVWNQITGSSVTLSDVTAAGPAFTAPEVDAQGETLVFQLTVTDSNGLQDTDTVIVNVTWQNVPPTADAGIDQVVTEGGTVTLDGSLSNDPDDGLVAFAWTQTEGPTVTLSDPTASNPTFVTVPVDADGSYLTFQLVVSDAGGLQASDEVVITVNDNHISGFAADVLTLTTATGDPVGITLRGGKLIKLAPLASIGGPELEDQPDSLIYGLLDIIIKADAVGGTAILTVYLPSPAPEGYTWFNYDASEGWRDCSEQVTFNSARDQISIALEDGGLGDDDGVANGFIEDPAGLGRAIDDTIENTTDAADSADNNVSPGITDVSSGGCFISSVSPFGIWK
ncbi:MAG: PKD domain-containing protein [Thermodesulfobacteriota bacterium]|nr:PKD domain-containing protein [Thermodesulfobacteriota bacterium]